jgi:hypothetical protein
MKCKSLCGQKRETRLMAEELSAAAISERGIYP